MPYQLNSDARVAPPGPVDPESSPPAPLALEGVLFAASFSLWPSFFPCSGGVAFFVGEGLGVAFATTVFLGVALGVGFGVNFGEGFGAGVRDGFAGGVARGFGEGVADGS